jgi:hypothetical protein
MEGNVKGKILGEWLIADSFISVKIFILYTFTGVAGRVIL